MTPAPGPAPGRFDPGDIAAAREWLRAVERADVVEALEGIYAHIADDVTRRGPVCWASGRCCNFEKTGHRLYVTGLEAAWCVLGMRDSGAATMEGIAAARERGGCPFQVGNLCGAREVRPVGCRVYFCDRSAQVWQRELSEAALRDVRALHEAERLEYRYGEWRGMLELVVGAGG